STLPLEATASGSLVMAPPRLFQVVQPLPLKVRCQTALSPPRAKTSASFAALDDEVGALVMKPPRLCHCTIPVPDRLAVCCWSAASSLMVIVPVRWPAWVGVKLSQNVQLSPGAST